MPTDERNRERADRVKVALNAYRHAMGEHREDDDECDVVDLLTDIRHFLRLDMPDSDFDVLVRMSEVHFEAEVDGFDDEEWDNECEEMMKGGQ